MSQVIEAARSIGLIEGDCIQGLENENGEFYYEPPTPEDLECIILCDPKTGRTKVVFTEFPDHRHQPLENLKNYAEEL